MTSPIKIGQVVTLAFFLFGWITAWYTLVANAVELNTQPHGWLDPHLVLPFVVLVLGLVRFLVASSDGMMLVTTLTVAQARGSLRLDNGKGWKGYRTKE